MPVKGLFTRVRQPYSSLGQGNLVSTQGKSLGFSVGGMFTHRAKAIIATATALAVSPHGLGGFEPTHGQDDAKGYSMITTHRETVGNIYPASWPESPTKGPPPHHEENTSERISRRNEEEPVMEDADLVDGGPYEDIHQVPSSDRVVAGPPPPGYDFSAMRVRATALPLPTKSSATEFVMFDALCIIESLREPTPILDDLLLETVVNRKGADIGFGI